jgi:hypothetical protein
VSEGVHYLSVGRGCSDHVDAAAGVSEEVKGFLGGALKLLLYYRLE